MRPSVPATDRNRNAAIMSDALIKNAPSLSYATPHQLCRCCKRLAANFAHIYPTMQEREERLCPHYDSLQDLLDGAQEGCHICILAYEEMKVTPWQEQQQEPLWLQSGSYIEHAPETHTCIVTHESDPIMLVIAYFELWTSEKIQCRRSLRIEPWSDMTHPKEIESAQLSNHTASDEHYQLIQGWLDKCTDEKQHPVCNTNQNLRRPTRLLDLTHYPDDVLLVNGDVSDGLYAALSYCWGSAPQLMLLQANLQQFQERMRLVDLSKVSQDAIAVCRKLSIPYLWVDAICIVQGEDGDFLSEAPRMQDVYAGSVFSIVAAYSKDSTEPFLVRRNPLAWIDCDLGPTAGDLGPDHTVVGGNFCERNEPGSYPIDSRGWYLQERFMSPRSIYFGKQGVHWECRHGFACEFDLPIHEHHRADRNVARRTSRLKSHFADLQSMQPKSISDVSRFYDIWRGLLEAYSATGLSHAEDGLIAIAGVASMFETKLHWISTYGLWVDHLIQDLLWYYCTWKSKVGNTDAIKHLPSWSWISTNGHPISLCYPYHANAETNAFHSATVISWPSEDLGFKRSLLSIPERRRLCIKGHLVPYTESWTGSKSEHCPIRGSTESFRYHDSDPGTSKTDLYCLLLLSQISPQKRHLNYGLVLTPVDKEEHCYRRTGVIFEHHLPDEFPDAPASHFVQGKIITDIWAPLGEEQVVSIV